MNGATLLMEELASHGYVIASIEHTGNSDAYYQGTLFDSVRRSLPASASSTIFTSNGTRRSSPGSLPMTDCIAATISARLSCQSDLL